MLLLIIGSVAFGRFGYDVAFVIDVGPAIAYCIAVAWAARWVGFEMIAAIIEMTALFMLIGLLTPFCAVIIASANPPLVDATLAWIDRAVLGFDRGAMMAWLATMPSVGHAFVRIYDSIIWQPAALILLLICTGRADRAWTALAAWAIALVMSLLIFGLAPAYGTPPYVIDFVGVLDGARDGSLRKLGSSSITGIITFPSFHAAAATIFAWGFRALPGLGWPMIALNAAMIVSALVVGGHYLIDLPTRMLVAWVAIVFAKRLCATLPSDPDAGNHVQPDGDAPWKLVARLGSRRRRSCPLL